MYHRDTAGGKGLKIVNQILVAPERILFSNVG